MKDGPDSLAASCHEEFSVWNTIVKTSIVHSTAYTRGSPGKKLTKPESYTAVKKPIISTTGVTVPVSEINRLHLSGPKVHK